MTPLLRGVIDKAIALRIPIGVHLDLTWSCNEACLHCYLDQSVGGGLTTGEARDALDQLASAGTLFLTLSGGEIMLRKDIFEIVAHARSLSFDVRLKSNGTLIAEEEARRFASLGVRQFDISLYSHRPEVHDAITRAPGSLEKSVKAIRHLRRAGIAVQISIIVLRETAGDYPALRALAAELGATPKIDPIVTPRMDGDPSPLSMRVSAETLHRIYHDTEVVGDVEAFCQPPAPPSEGLLSSYSCGAGRSGCYISPSRDVMPCVDYPLVCGNLRHQSFAEIWGSSPGFAAVRAQRIRDLPVCGACPNVAVCRRCPGLAYREGDVLGPSILDCEAAVARTGIPSPAMRGGSGAIPRDASNSAQ